MFLLTLGVGYVVGGMTAWEERKSLGTALLSVAVVPPIFGFGMLIVLLSPLVIWLYYVHAQAPSIYERAVLYRKCDMLQLIALVACSAICGIALGVCAFRFFGLNKGYAGVIGVIGILASGLAVWITGTSRAFATNPVADWLRSHPRGEEVLREFSC